MKAEDIISKYVKFREGGFVPQENPYDRFRYNTSDNTRVVPTQQKVLTTEEAKKQAQSFQAAEAIRKKQVQAQKDAEVKARMLRIAESEYAKTQPVNAENLSKIGNALGDKMRFSYEPNAFDDYLNPFVWVGESAGGLAQIPQNIKDKNYVAVAYNIGSPVFAGIGSRKITGLNNALGKKYFEEVGKEYAQDEIEGSLNLRSGAPQFQQGGRVPIYVDSKNDPSYKAYNDSLSAYNYGQTLPNLWESSDLQYFNQEFANNRGTIRRDTLNRGDRLEYPTQRTTNGTSRINAWENSYRNINPVAIGRSSLYLNNRLVNPSNIPAIVEYPIYPKPQQPVKLKPKETERMLEATLPEVTVRPPVDYSKSGLHYSIGVDKGKVVYRVGSVGNMKVLTPAQFEEFKKTPDFQMYNEVRKNDTSNVEQYLTNPTNAYPKMENGGEIKLDKEKLSMMMQKIFGK